MASISQLAATSALAKPTSVRLPPSRKAFGFVGLASVIGVLAAPMAVSDLSLLMASIALLIAGFTLASVAWSQRKAWDGETPTMWDVSGLLVLLGFTAALLADPVSKLTAP